VSREAEAQAVSTELLAMHALLYVVADLEAAGLSGCSKKPLIMGMDRN
jgi:hypothetical protein